MTVSVKSAIIPPRIGFDPTKFYYNVVPTATVGEYVECDDGSGWVFCKTESALTAYLAYFIDETFVSGTATTQALVASGGKQMVGVPNTSITAPSGQTYSYCWLQVKGAITVYAANTSADAGNVYVTTLGGKLDDGDTTGSIITGAFWTSTAASAATGTIFAVNRMWATS